jgi:hypothetical protein
MASLEEIRKKLQEQEGRKAGQGNKKNNFDNTVFPFWNMGTGDESTVRFLPDGDQNNTYFWAERQLINIPFSGIIGGEDKEVTVSVPCVEMWGEQCPVHQEIRPWYKQPDEQLKQLANVYWKKRTYLFQGFVRKSKLAEEAPENPIRKFWFKPQVFNLIKTIILDPEVTHSPTHYEQGFDFYLTKTTKGAWADYSTSRWARGASALTEEERNAITTHSLFNLCDSLPKKPTPQEVAAIYDMFTASLDGAKYDPEKWGQYFRPRGVDFSQKSENQQQSAPVSVQVPAQINKTDESDEIPFNTQPEPVVNVAVQTTQSNEVPTTVTKPVQSAKEILDALRNRNA